MTRTFPTALLLVAVCVLRAQTTASPAAWKPVLDRLEATGVVPLSEWRFHADVPHPEDVSLNDSDWAVVKAGSHWRGPGVLRRLVEMPATVAGYDVRGVRVKLDLMMDSWSPVMLTVFSNGPIVARVDKDMLQPIALTESAQPGQKFLIAIRVDTRDDDIELKKARLLLEPPAARPDPGLLRMEILSAYPVVHAYEEGRAQREQQLEAAVQSIDVTALDRGDQAGFDNSLRAAQAKLEALRPWLQQFTIRATGNSHIDMAWLWPWTETVEIVRDTFRSALDLIREYPDLTFSMGSAQTFSWMEEKYPDMFGEIQQRVKEGRWEIVGGMWVEPDLNMPAGESLVRQLLVGKRYFQQKFGVDVKIGWNPDSFGYSWQLPQIYKRSGVDYFVTQKMSWGDTTKFPHKLFWWESPDGSRVLAYFPQDYAGGIDAEHMATNLSVWAPALYGTATGNQPEMMHLFGVGDHGGGPTREMLDNAARLQSAGVVYPKLKFGTAAGFFADLEKKLPEMKVPTWKDELYFEYHRGVMTTQADTKQRIRHSEEVLLNAEKFSSFAMPYGYQYPQEKLEDAWRRLLFDHFHDIMPGSGIAANYLDVKRNLEEVDRLGGEAMDGGLRRIAANIATDAQKGIPVVVFNSLSWPRTEVVEIEAQLPGPASDVEVVDSAGARAASEVLATDANAARTNTVRVLVAARVPALGYQTYYVRAGQAVPQPGVKASADSLENEFVRVMVDPQTGCITSLFDKRSGTEALSPAETDTGGPKNRVCGNLLQAFVDKPKKWDAWNIDADFEKQHWDIDKADEVKLVESGPLRAVIRVRTHFQQSAFIQDITVYAGVPRVDVKMQADWHEKHILLKVAFPVSAHNDKATFEIPFGSIERPTTRRTPAEQAKFEVPAERWVDLSDARHGFSLLNDCKYGYDAKGNVLRLSLLRSPDFPDPHADEGHHAFTYSLYPHGGGWREALTVRRGYELNYPLLPITVANHTGSLPDARSFLDVREDNVVVTAVKKSEDDDALVIRFYEWAGRRGDVHLRLPEAPTRAEETDLMERPDGHSLTAQREITVPVAPFEIKTVKVSLR
ncbi:MAG: alpha-mannosidase [Bryobacteraceae bacterium]|jgi:alpha-mannosidase